MNVRRQVAAVVVALPLFAAVAGAQSEGVPMLTPEQFVVLPWGWTPGDAEALAGIRECGFNLAGFVNPEHLDLVAEAGLKALVSDSGSHADDAACSLSAAEIAQRLQATVGKVAGHPACFGYYLRDEPGAVAFPGLARWVAGLAVAAPGALPYINLFPTYASPQQLGAATYAEYVESYITTVKPPFISYDHYALMADGGLRDGYFQNLEAVRAAALRHRLPFWNCVLANAHFNYAEPSDAGLRFQLYTTLAYGGRGISYFTYFAPNVGNYRLAAVDQFGHPTATWERLRNVNLQLHRLGPTYVTLTSVNVFHHPEVPSGCSGLASSRFLTAVSGGDLLVGEFEGAAGQPYVLVVNKDLQHSTPYDVNGKTAGAVQWVNAYTGTHDPWGGEHKWLAPGQGMLLALPR
jgi:hypothetical protein